MFEATCRRVISRLSGTVEFWRPRPSELLRLALPLVALVILSQTALKEQFFPRADRALPSGTHSRVVAFELAVSPYQIEALVGRRDDPYRDEMRRLWWAAASLSMIYALLLLGLVDLLPERDTVPTLTRIAIGGTVIAAVGELYIGLWILHAPGPPALYLVRILKGLVIFRLLAWSMIALILTQQCWKDTRLASYALIGTCCLTLASILEWNPYWMEKVVTISDLVYASIALSFLVSPLWFIPVATRSRRMVGTTAAEAATITGLPSLMARRFPVVTSGLLLLLPFGLRWALPQLLVMEGAIQIAVVAFLAFNAGMTVVLSFLIVHTYVRERYTAGNHYFQEPAFTFKAPAMLIGAFALGSPTVYQCGLQTHASGISTVSCLLSAALGFFLAGLLTLGLMAAFSVLYPHSEESNGIDVLYGLPYRGRVRRRKPTAPWVRRTISYLARHTRIVHVIAMRRKGIRRLVWNLLLPLLLLLRRSPNGYLNEKRSLHYGHLYSIFAIGSWLLTYHIVGFLGRNVRADQAPPTLAYILIIFIIATWIGCAASFFLDHYRLPAVGTLVVVFCLLGLSADVDHVFPVRARHSSAERTPLAEGLTPNQAFDAWFRYRSPHQKPIPVVVVAVNGGGILAAAWGTQVLSGLEEMYGPRFRKSIAAMSGVSGGSMGIMFYVNAMLNRKPGADAVEAAEAGALREVGWGLAYPDLTRTLFAGFADLVYPPTLDRGETLERAWVQELGRSRPTLGSWRTLTRHGTIPAIVFNATCMETGQPFMLSTLSGYSRDDYDRSKLDKAAKLDVTARFNAFWERLHLPPWRQNLFFDRFPELDVNVTTAVRLSATFPYVTPISRPLLADPNDMRTLHLADGGYYDTTALSAIVQWLEGLGALQRGRISKLLVITIKNPSASPRLAGGLPSRPYGWSIALLGPLQTAVKVMFPDGNSRGDLALESLLRRRYGFPVAVAQFQMMQPGVLSWQLSRAEREAVTREWTWRKAIQHGGKIDHSWSDRSLDARSSHRVIEAMEVVDSFFR